MHTWTPSQRRVLIGLLSVLTIYFSIRYFHDREFVGDPQPPAPSHFNDLADKIDPNTAAEHELAALPIIGEKRAAAIVAYRIEFAKDHPGEISFTKPTDLLRIKGIGGAMLTNLEPFLIFPSTQPTTMSSSTTSAPR